MEKKNERMIILNYDDLNIIPTRYTKNYRFVSGVLFSPKRNIISVTDGKYVTIRSLYSEIHESFTDYFKVCSLQEDFIITFDSLKELKRRMGKPKSISIESKICIFDEDKKIKALYVKNNKSGIVELEKCEGTFPPIEKIIPDYKNMINLSFNKEFLDKIYLSLQGANKEETIINMLLTIKENKIDPLVLIYTKDFFSLLMGTENNTSINENIIERTKNV